jgi:tetratricopeptide (TPR) repeat protein
MLRQFNRFLVVALVCAVVLYITLTNSERATLKLGQNISITTYAGLIYIGVFALGCVTASLCALFFGLKSYLRERKLRAHEKSRQLFFDLFIKARGLMAAQEWGAAREIWEKVLRHDHANVIARVELADCLESLGDPKEALRILNETRAESKQSPEVLFKAAELNRKLGNNTAASDNISLLLVTTPSKAALEMARDSAAEVGNLDTAIEYQNQVERMGYSEPEVEEARLALLLKRVLKENPSKDTAATALAQFVKKYPIYAPGLEAQAEVLLALGNLDQAAEALVKAAKHSSGDCSKWERVVNLWLTQASGDFVARANRAISAAKSASQDRSGERRLEAELLLARTLLRANRPEEAHKTVSGLQALAEREGTILSPQLTQQTTAILGLSLARLSKTAESAALWQQIVFPGESTANERSSKGSLLTSARAEPSPALSTP